MSSEILYHIEQWLILKEKIIEKKFVDDGQRRAFIDQQDFHADRYTVLMRQPLPDGVYINLIPPIL